MGRPDQKHILVVDNSVAVTGALKAILQSAAELREEFTFSFVLPAASTATDHVRAAGFEVTTLPFIEISKRPQQLLLYGPYLLLNGWRLARLAAERQAAILHFNDFYNLTGLVARLFGAKARLLTHVRFMPHRFGALAKAWAWLHLRFSQRIICVSEAVRSFFPPGNAKVLLIPDSLPSLERHEPKVVAARAEGQPVELLYLANYIMGKGQDHALAAFSRAYAENPRLRLTYIGGDMGLEKNRLFRQQLMRQVQEQGLDKVVQFRDFVHDVEAAIKQADILLNFSESESFSLTCLDALYFGTPLIASDCGGPAELFENGRSGLLVPNRDVAAMTTAILELAADLPKRQRFAQAGKAFVREKFSRQQTSAQLAQVYRQL